MHLIYINELITQEMPMYMNVPWVVFSTETQGGCHLVGFRKALLRFWWAISPQVYNHCTGGPGKWWATTGGPGERHWNCGWAEAVKATCNGHQCYTGAMGALLLGHHDHAQNFEQRQNIFSFTIINIFVLCTKRPGVWSTPQVVIKTTLFRQLCT